MHSRDTLEQLFGYPLELTLTWFVFAPGAAYLCGRILYEETIRTWREGPIMVLFGFTHQAPPVIILYCFLSMIMMHIWLVIALCWIRKEKKYGHVIPRPGFWIFIGTAIAIGFTYIPYSWLGGY